MNIVLVYTRTFFLIILFLCIIPYHKSVDAAIRVKDIAYIKGVRDNQLYGYGLVAGLQGSGDSQIFRFTRQLAVNIFEKLGVLISDSDFLSRNIAAVTITVNIPAFSRPGVYCGHNPVYKKDACGADAVTTIKRSDFGINYALPAVSDEVKLLIQVEAHKN